MVTARCSRFEAVLQEAKTFTKLISTINELMEMAEFEVGRYGPLSR